MNISRSPSIFRHCEGDEDLEGNPDELEQIERDTTTVRAITARDHTASGDHGYLGAPFWFDTLKKFVSIRSAGKAPEERPLSPKEVSQPREPGQRPKEADLLGSTRGR